MINNPQVEQSIWTVYDPKDGIMPLPQEDKIIQVSKNMDPPMVLLNDHNYISYEPYHWTNDYYGNLIEIQYIFSSYAPAVDFLREYWTEKYALVAKESARLRTILRSLDT